MKRLMLVLAIAATVLATAAWAQGPGVGDPGQRPMGRDGGHRMMGPGAIGGGQMGRAGAMRGGQGMLLRLNVEVNRESKAVWDRITKLQTQIRARQWEYFTLKSQGAGEEQLQAKLEQLRDLTEQLREARQEFRQFVTVPEGAGPGAGMHRRGMQGRGMQGRGMHRPPAPDPGA